MASSSLSLSTASSGTLPPPPASTSSSSSAAAAAAATSSNNPVSSNPALAQLLARVSVFGSLRDYRYEFASLNAADIYHALLGRSCELRESLPSTLSKLMIKIENCRCRLQVAAHRFGLSAESSVDNLPCWRDEIRWLTSEYFGYCPHLSRQNFSPFVALQEEIYWIGLGISLDLPQRDLPLFKKFKTPAEALPSPERFLYRLNHLRAVWEETEPAGRNLLAISVVRPPTEALCHVYAGALFQQAVIDRVRLSEGNLRRPQLLTALFPKQPHAALSPFTHFVDEFAANPGSTQPSVDAPTILWTMQHCVHDLLYLERALLPEKGALFNALTTSLKEWLTVRELLLIIHSYSYEDPNFAIPNHWYTVSWPSDLTQARQMLSLEALVGASSSSSSKAHS